MPNLPARQPEETIGTAGPENVFGDRAVATGVIFVVAADHPWEEIVVDRVATTVVVEDLPLEEIVVDRVATTVVVEDLPLEEIVVDRVATTVAVEEIVRDLAVICVAPEPPLPVAHHPVDQEAPETTNGARGWKVSCDRSMPIKTAFSSRMKYPKIENASSAT